MLIVKIRKSMKKTFARIVLFLVTMTVVGGYGLSRVFSKLFSKTTDGVGMVNGHSLSIPTFNRLVYEEEQKIRAVRQRYQEKADLYMQLMGVSSNPKISALHMLIVEELMHQYADSIQLHLSDQYVHEKINDPNFVTNEIGYLLPGALFNKDGKINVYALTQFMAQPAMEGIRLQLTEKLRNKFAQTLFLTAYYIPEFLIKDMYIQHDVAKKYSVQHFSMDHFKHQADQLDISKDQLRAFYEEKSQKNGWYWVPEQRYGIVWTFTPDDYGVQVTEQEIEDYYQKNKTTKYKDKPARFKVREIVFNQAEVGFENLKKNAIETYERVLKNPDSFADVAREVSQNKDTASQGGLVDYFERGTKDVAYEKAVIRLKNNGDISPVTQVGNSFIIVQRVDRKEATFLSFEKVRNAIVDSLTEQKFKRLFAKEADASVRNSSDVMNTFISDHKGSKKEIGPVEKQESVYPKIFSIRKDGDCIAYIDQGKGYIIQLTKKNARRLPSFSEIQDIVKRDYKEQKALDLLSDAVYESRKNVLQEGSFAHITGAHMDHTGFINPQDQDMYDEYISKKGYPEDFIKMTIPGQIAMHVDEKGGILIRLDELKIDDLSAYNDQKNDVEGQAFSTMYSVFSNACLASLFRNATIKFNEELIQEKDALL